MFAWFQRLLPKSGDFFTLFERQAAHIVAASEALCMLATGEGAAAAHVRTIHDREHDADEVLREVLQEVRNTFLTPFDRGAIASLINALDDTIDEMNSSATAVELYEIASFDPQQREIAQMLVQGAKLVAEAMPLLRDVARNGQRLHEVTARIVQLEGQVDTLYDTGMRALFQAQQKRPDPLGFVVGRELYKHLERVADAFEDVANEIDSLVIDHA